MNQDFVTWVGQGRIADRSQEYLGPSDSGIVMIRRRFLRDLDAVARGEDPKAVIRDPARNRTILLPVADRLPLIDGLTRAEMLRDPLSRRGLEGYIFQTGQPPEVRDAFLAAMGFNGTEFAPPDDLFDPLAPAPR
jgi:5,5'-dehydrodivanillate O-demethylase